MGSPAPGGDPHRRRPLTWMGRRPGVGSAHLHTKDQSVRHRRAAARRWSSRTPGRAAADLPGDGSTAAAARPARPSAAAASWLPDFERRPGGLPNFHFPRKGAFSQVPERGMSASARCVRRDAAGPKAREPEPGRRARPGRQPKARRRSGAPRGRPSSRERPSVSPGLESGPSVLLWRGRREKTGEARGPGAPACAAEHPRASRPLRLSPTPRLGPGSGWRGNDVRLRLKLCSSPLLYLYPSPRRPSWVLTPVR